MVMDLSRRRLLGGSLAALSVTALGGLLSACGDDGSPASAAGTPAPDPGPWSWTDDLGQEISLDATPTRIAAYGDAAAALINFGITPVALFHYMDPAQDSTFEDIDLSEIEVVGTAYGEISLEALAAARPELIVTTLYDGDTPDSMYGFKDEAQLAKIKAIAPVVGVMQTGSALDVIETNEKLVASLGIDVDAGPVADDRAAFEEASTALTKAAGSGLTVLPIYGEDANLYVAKAPDDPALRYYSDLGLSFVPVEGEDYYWEVLSWEQADKYRPDIVLYSVRDSFTPEQLLDQPVFARLEVARAGQLHPWKFKSMDYKSQTSYLEELAGWLASDSKVT
jgi:iron complex transport system substrate-binding protein